MEHGQGLDQRRNTQTQPVGRCISDDKGSDKNTRRPILRACKVGCVVGWGEGRSEVDLSDMRDFCTAVDGGNGVFRCGESCGGLREGCRKERRRKGEWKVEEEEWMMDGSITGFTELTASKPAAGQPAQHKQYWLLLLDLGALGGERRTESTRAMCPLTNVT